MHLLFPSTLHHASASYEIAKTETSLNMSISFGSPSTAPSAKYLYGCIGRLRQVYLYILESPSTSTSKTRVQLMTPVDFTKYLYR